MKYFGIIATLIFTQSAYAVPSAIMRAANKVGVPSALLEAVCYKESKLQADVIRLNDGGPGVHAFGTCQVHYRTAKWLGFDDINCELNDFSDKALRNYKHCKLFDPYINAYWAAKYMQYQLTRYGRLRHAIAAYNSGTAYICETGTTKSGRSCDIGLFVNQPYVDSILEYYDGKINTISIAQEN